MTTSNLLPPLAIKEFKDIYLKLFGKELQPEEAEKHANELFELYDAVYGKRHSQKT